MTRLNLKPHVDIVFRGKDTVITVKNQREPLPYSWKVHCVAGPLAFIKVASSLGLRIYAVVDFLTNKEYIFYSPVVSHIPKEGLLPTYIYTGFSDAVMNGATRGYSIYEMVAKWFAPKEDDVESDVEYDHEGEDENEKTAMTCCSMVKKDGLKTTLMNQEFWKKIVFKKSMVYFVDGCGMVSLFSVSLTTFLGVVTLIGLATDNVYANIIPGILCAIANFLSNYSYRINKVNRNLAKLYNKELRCPTWYFELPIILLGSVAFIGECDYGVSHSLWKFFKLLGLYDGDLDKDIHNIWKDLIYGITDFILGPAVVIFLLGQCCEMLKIEKVPEEDDNNLILPYNKVYNNYKRYLRHEKKTFCYCCPPITLLPLLVRVIVVSLGYWATMPGELLGNGILKFNGGAGLIYRSFTENPYAVGIISLVATLVNGYIYWHFNVNDWYYAVKKVFVMSVLHALKRLGVYSSNAADYLVLLTKALTGNAPKEPKFGGVRSTHFGQNGHLANHQKLTSTGWSCLFPCSRKKRGYVRISGGDDDIAYEGDGVERNGVFAEKQGFCCS